MKNHIEVVKIVVLIMIAWLIMPIANAAKYSVYTVVVEGKGKVIGNGSYKKGTKVKIEAVPANGYVFAGWGDNIPDDMDISPDWDLMVKSGKKNPFTYTVRAVDVWNSVSFIKKSEDTIDEIECDSTWYVNREKGDEFYYNVHSASEATTVATGLPAGMKIYSNRIRVTKPSTLPVGVRNVMLTATNLSGHRKTKTVKLYLPNISAAVDEGVLEMDTSHDGYRLRVGVCVSLSSLGISTASGWKIVKIAGLPNGVSWNMSTQELTGFPTKKGTYTVTFTVKKGSKSYKASA